MTIQGWTYIGIALVLWRVFAGMFWRDAPHAGELAAVFAGAVGALFWPVVVAVIAVYQACVRWPNFMRWLFIAKPSRARRQRKLSEARKRVHRLERELLDG